MIGKATKTLMINGTHTADNNDNILMIQKKKLETNNL